MKDITVRLRELETAEDWPGDVSVIALCVEAATEIASLRVALMKAQGMQVFYVPSGPPGITHTLRVSGGQ